MPNPRTRPSSIHELAEEALDNPWDPSKELKAHLRQAEKTRLAGKDFKASGDLESAFVEFARAATLVLEKLPQHRDYNTLLNKQQRHNLSLNGQDILDSLQELKPVLVKRHGQWATHYPDDTTTPTARSLRDQQGGQQSNAEEERRRVVAEELYKMKQQRETSYPTPAHAPLYHPSVPAAPSDPRKNAALAAARQAAGSISSASSQAARYHDQQQSQDRHVRGDVAPRTRQDAAARAVQHRLAGGNGIITSNTSSPIYQMPSANPPSQPNQRHDPSHAVTYRRPPPHDVPNLIMPLSRPGYDTDSTDSESIADSHVNSAPRGPSGPSYARSPTRDLVARM